MARSASRAPPRPAAHQKIAEIGTEAVRAAKQFAVVQDAEAEAALDGDDQEIVELAPLAEPMFGERDQIDVAVDDDGDAEPARQQRRRNATSRSEKIGLCRQTPAARSHDAGQADAEPGDVLHFEFGVADAAPHAILDEIGDHRRRLPVDADRQRELC